MKALVEQKINRLKRQLSAEQKTQLLKLSQEFNAFAIIAKKIEASDILDILERTKSRVDPIVFRLFRAMLLLWCGDYKKALDILTTRSDR